MAGISTSPSGVGLPIGLAGATAATRYVGGTASGAPASGTFAVGDFVVDQVGNVFVCVTAGTPGTWTNASKSRAQLAITAQGMLAECWPLLTATNAGAALSQVVYGALIGLVVNDSVTGIRMQNNVAAAGTTPTTVRAGIADATGKILALSGNLNAAASWPAGAVQLALTAPFTVPVSGGYFACLVLNGAWGTTQPSIVRGTLTANFSTGIGASAPPAFQWTGQTDLPAVNSSVTITAGSQLAFYMAFY